MGVVPVATLIKTLRFLTEPLDCNENPMTKRLLSTLAAQGQWRAFSQCQPLLESICQLSCGLRIRPALLVSLATVICIVVVATIYNACVKLVRWYAAARGSAFVAVATQALREIHASGALLDTVAAAGGGCILRPATAHRWYTPQAVTSPVVCCGCFQPVVVAQGAEGRAQCCELCGLVAHGSCVKAVPHNCRLLALALPPPHQEQPTTRTLPPSPPLPHDWRPAGTTLDLILPPADAEMLLGGSDDSGVGAGSGPAAPHGSVSTSHGPSSLCLYCAEPCEVGLLAVEPVWRCGACRRFAHVQCWSSLHPGALSAATRAALEGQALEAEEISGSPRGASFQWDRLDEAQATRGDSTGDGTGRDGGGPPLGASEAPPAAAAAAAAAAAPTIVAAAVGSGAPDELPPARLRGDGTAANDGTVVASAGSTSGEGYPAAAATTEQTRTHRQSARALYPAGNGGGGAAAATAAAPSAGGAAASTAQKPCIDGRGGPAGRGGDKGAQPQRAAASAAAATGGVWDESRRCQSLPNIAGTGRGGGGDGTSGMGDGAVPRTATADPTVGGVGAEVAGLRGGGGGGVLSVRCRADPGRLARLDRCDPQASLGVLGAMVLPPTAVHPINGRMATLFASARGKPAAAAASATSGGGGAAPASGAAGAGRGGGRKKLQPQQQLGRSLRQRAQKWYRSHAAGWSLGSSAAADAAAPERWRHFRIGPSCLPPGCRPLLVFINPRSGPQAGEQLRRQLLQLLHPMQVVDLLREPPGAALRGWWGVPGLRVLVVGGDGTAGWILGEMENLAAELAAAAQAATAADGGGNGEPEVAAVAAAVPQPPAVAVLPLGTGNDLARVLGWGGGLAALDARGGVAAVLAEVAAAAPTPLDRWGLSIATATPEPQKRRSSFLPRRRQLTAAATAAAAARSPPMPAVLRFKVFNNYLGVGIDSWCALEFHKMRERYPGWFKSQLGNKMWYTGVGARDLLARSCVDLPSRLTLQCDGQPLELPPGTQGILLLNIPSYMGGVDLWGNGLPYQPYQQPYQQQVHGMGGSQGMMCEVQGLRGAAAAAAPTGAAAAAAAGGGGAGGRESNSPDRAAAPGSSNGPNGGGGAAAVAMAVASGTGGTAAARHGGGGGSPSGATTSGGRASPDVTVAVAVPPASAPLQPSTTPLTQPLHPEAPQSISDGVLEVVVVYGAVHLGQLQVGLARATRLCQCRTAVITTRQALPMQVDGEPWMQPPVQLSLSLRGTAMVLRRLDPRSTASRLTAAVGEVLDGAVTRGTISAAQRQALGAELARRLGAPHAV